jgi:hypothetical protein
MVLPAVGVCSPTNWVQALTPKVVDVISKLLPAGQTTCV